LSTVVAFGSWADSPGVGYDEVGKAVWAGCPCRSQIHYSAAQVGAWRPMRTRSRTRGTWANMGRRRFESRRDDALASVAEVTFALLPWVRKKRPGHPQWLYPSLGAARRDRQLIMISITRSTSSLRLDRFRHNEIPRRGCRSDAGSYRYSLQPAKLLALRKRGCEPVKRDSARTPRRRVVEAALNLRLRYNLSENSGC
jgi:hypothetical protein